MQNFSNSSPPAPESEMKENKKLEDLLKAEKILQETLVGHSHKRVAEMLLDIYDPKSMTKEQQRAVSVIIKFCRQKVMESVHDH